MENYSMKATEIAVQEKEQAMITYMELIVTPAQ
jgi:hypothetical protein